MASTLGARWGRCVMLTIIVLMSIAQVDCNNKKTATPAPAPSPAPSETVASAVAGGFGTLVIEDNSLASWIAINNSFASSGNYWAGLLVQVGDFSTPNPPLPRTFKRVVLSKGANEVKEIKRDNNKLFWVNIVSESSIPSAPMAPEKVAALYPSGYDNGVCAAPNVDQKCLRGQKIHSEMNPVLGVLTYWQGPNGYTVTVKQPAADKPSMFTFQLLDKFKIEVYEIASDGTMAIQSSFTSDDIDKIAISPNEANAAIIPPSDGDKQDPPWPGK